MRKHRHIYGLLAQYDAASALLDAARFARNHGYRKMDAYSPFPVHGLREAVGARRSWIPLIVLIAGVTGAVTGFGMCYFAQVIHYPFNVGGRPLNSWPMYIAITFELTVLFGGLTAMFAMLAANRLPEPYHPLFNVPNFDLATSNRFFLCIESDDPRFDPDATAEFLRGTQPTRVSLVPTGRVKTL